MPRLLSTIIGISVIFASCAGKAPEDRLAGNCAVERTPVERFSLCVPDGWNARLEQFGEVGSFIVYVRPKESTESLMQIHVKKDPLEENVRSSMAFARRAVEIARETAPNYQPVSTEPISINAEETLLHIFDASPDPGSPSVRYYQFVTTSGGIAYGFTAVMFPGENEELHRTLLQIFTNVMFT